MRSLTTRHASRFAHHLVRLSVLLLIALSALGPAALPASSAGSRILSVPGTGWRPFIEWHETAISGGIPRRTTIKAYAVAGEQIYVGSSAVGIGAGDIRFRGPDGTTTGTCLGLAQGQPADYGRIDDINEENAGALPAVGGYRPCVISAALTNQAGTGIWEFDFLSPNPSARIDQNPTPIRSNDAWAQSAANHWVNAWDVSVRNNANQDVPGRVFANYIAFNMGNNAGTGGTAADLGFYAEYYIITNDGYGYRVNMNGIDPFGFIFFSNAEGVVDARGLPIYRSIQLVGVPPNVNLPANFRLHDPGTSDNLVTHDITHKIFFEPPDPTLPQVARSPGGSTWLLPQTQPPPRASNFTFTGIEGTPGQAGTAPLSGYFEFDAPANTNFEIVIDANNNGLYTDPVDPVIRGITNVGRTRVPWNGLDQLGNRVPAGPRGYSAQLQLNAGEVHFPFTDAENNQNGIILQRFRDLNLATEPGADIVYYNDAYSYTGASAYDYSPCAATGDAPAPPADAIGAGANTAVCYGIPSEPRSTAINGVASLGGAHAYSGGSQLGFGDRRLIDTWAYYPSDPIAINGNILLAEAELSVTKDHSPASFTPGEPVFYTVVVRNGGPSAAVGAKVDDDVPPEINNVTWSCAITGTGACGAVSGSGNTIATTVNLASGSLATFTIQGILNPAATGSLVNVATVRRPNDNTDIDLSNNTARNVAPIIGVADLELNKTVRTTPPIASGSEVEFAIELRNRGPSIATNVEVTDRLPTGLTFVSARAEKGSYDSVSGIWTVGTMVRDEAVTLLVRAIWDGSSVENTAEVTRSSERDPDSTPGNHDPREDDQSSARLPLQIADLELTKRVDQGRVNVGSNVSFAIVLANRGPNTATGVRVSDRLPVGLSLVSATPSQGGYDATSGTWSVGSLAPNAVVTLNIVATVLGPGPFTNVAQVSSSDQYDPDSRPNNDNPQEDDQSFATVAGDLIDLSLSKTVDNPQPPHNGRIIYTIKLDNAGPSNATGVVVRDDLPAGLSFIRSTASRGSYNVATGLWTVGSLAANASATLTIEATVISGATIVNTAQVNAAGQPDKDSTPANNDPNEDDQASVQLTPQLADLELVKIVDNAQPPVGGEVNFTIELRNNGPNAASGVAVSEELPAGLTYISHVVSQGAYNPATGRWDVGSLNLAGTATLTLRARITGVGPYVNVAQVSNSDQFDPDSTPGNNVSGEDDQGSVSVGGQMADLSVSKRANAPRPATDGTITYTIGVHNAGPSVATGVVLGDQLPISAQVLVSNASQGTFDTTNNTWNVGRLNVGANATLTVRVQLTGPGPFTNVAQVTASDLPDPDSTPNNNDPNEDDQASVTVPTGIADLELDKDYVLLGRKLPITLVYILDLSNRGPDTATNVKVRDPLPAGVSLVSTAPSQGSYDPATGIWDVGTLAPNVTARLQLLVVFTTNNPVTNVAEVSSSDQFDTDSTPNNNIPTEDDQDFAIVDPLTAITLLDFSAAARDDGVLVLWTTGTELNSAGFKLYRSSGERADAVLVTPQLIVARGSAGMGASYSFLDSTAEPGVSYRYWLVEVERDGATHEYGPVSTDPRLAGGDQKVYLPLLN